MPPMGEPLDSDVVEPQPLVQAAPPAAPRAARSATGALALLLALVALIVAGFGAWRVVMLERGQGDAASALRAARELQTRLPERRRSRARPCSKRSRAARRAARRGANAIDEA